MARKLESADGDVEAVGPVDPRAFGDLEVDACVRRRDGLEVGRLRVEPPGGPRAIHAGRDRIRLAQDASVVRIEPDLGAALSRGARLAHGDVVRARPRSLANDQAVIIGRPAGAGLDILLSQAGGLDQLGDVGGLGRLGRDLRDGGGVGRPGGLPRARDEIPAAGLVFAHVERGVRGGRCARSGSLNGSTGPRGHRR